LAAPSITAAAGACTHFYLFIHIFTSWAREKETEKEREMMTTTPLHLGLVEYNKIPLAADQCIVLCGKCESRLGNNVLYAKNIQMRE